VPRCTEDSFRKGLRHERPEELAKVSAIPNAHDYCGKVCQRAAEIATELILEAAESEKLVTHKGDYQQALCCG
jgi:hypothetical protein